MSPYGARVEQFDSAKIFSQDPAALEALATLGFIEAMNTAAGNSAGAGAGMAGVAMTGARSTFVKHARSADRFFLSRREL